jgi:hypothetical protein
MQVGDLFKTSRIVKPFLPHNSFDNADTMLSTFVHRAAALTAHIAAILEQEGVSLES